MAKKKLGRRHPSSDPELGLRIEAAAKIVGTRVDAAKAAGISDDQLARMIDGTSQPSFWPLVALARAAGISLSWLATGIGDPRAADLPVKLLRQVDSPRGFAEKAASDYERAAGVAYDDELMRSCIRDFEAELAARGLATALSPANKAGAISMIYRTSLQERVVNRPLLNDIISLIRPPEGDG